MAEEEDLEYDSDPEDALRPSMMRRREASDDENSEREGENPARTERLVVRSDDELENEGGAPGYDEEEYEEEEEEMLEEEEVEVEVVLPDEGEKNRGEGEEEEEKKKENEPFAVPTAGAFYMHDDRFEANGRGRHRRMPGGRRLWESKDNQAWVHDRFEEMNLQDRRYEERRMPRGRFRGRGIGRGRGAGRGYGKGNRPRAYYDENNNQNRTIKSIRGRGPIRYEPLSNSSEIPASPKQHRKTQEPTSNNVIAKKFSHISDALPESVAPRKLAFASSLSSASPPFYPSGSSNQDMIAIQKRDLQTRNNKPLSSTGHMENFFSVSQPASLFRGKTVIDSVGFDRLHLDDSVHQVSEKAPGHTPVQASGTTLSLSNAKRTPYKVQGRNSTTTSMPNHPTSFNQVARIPSQNQLLVHQKPVQSQGQPSLRISSQQVGQHLVIGNQVASSPQASVDISSEGEEAQSPGDMSNSNSTLVGKGKIVNQAAGRGSFLYGGAQVIGPNGAVGVPHGDPNFAGTPALLPVMQFGGQHPGGIRVPAVGMALPGYVAQPSFGNSEMTWVPVLAGAAGALGASYCSPYIALDGTYYARPSGQASTSASSIKETSGAKPTNTLKPLQKTDIINDEFGQRQNKPRRYSEMNFGQ